MRVAGDAHDLRMRTPDRRVLVPPGDAAERQVDRPTRGDGPLHRLRREPHPDATGERGSSGHTSWCSGRTTTHAFIGRRPLGSNSSEPGRANARACASPSREKTALPSNDPMKALPPALAHGMPNIEPADTAGCTASTSSRSASHAGLPALLVVTPSADHRQPTARQSRGGHGQSAFTTGFAPCHVSGRR
jgi:hypothetical protein